MYIIYCISLLISLNSCKQKSEPNTSSLKTIEKSVAPTSANLLVVVKWMEISEKMRLGWYQRTASNARADATLALAMFETANAIEQEYPSFLGIKKVSKQLPIELAVSSAASKTLELLYPDKKNRITKAKKEILDISILDQQHKNAIELGEQIAQKAFERGKQQMNTVSINYPVTKPARKIASPGIYVPQYERSAIRDFDLKYVPWTLASQDQLRPLPPPNLSSKAYSRAYNEVKNIGNVPNTIRTIEQTETAFFWFLIEMNPILRSIATSGTRSITKNARMYAMFHMVTDDAWVAAADAKNYYQFWRPITATAHADEDNNSDTQPLKNWKPLMDTPPHPEYPCGHCVQAAAQQTVLALELDNPNQVFTIRSSGAKDAKARKVTLNDYVAQTLNSRLYAGAHFRFSNEVGKDLGQKVAQQVLERWSKLY